MSRALRSGRKYDPENVPPARRRGRRTNLDKDKSESVKDEGENKLTAVIRAPNPPSYTSGPSSGTAMGSRIGPRAYIALYGRTPPIRRVGWRTNNDARTEISRRESDAHKDVVDAERSSVRSANHALEASDRLTGAADRATGLRDEPHTPHREVDRGAPIEPSD
ncbi:hypothetical protein FRC07_008685 [Ceratobasidium sp. 392]|nr:hypothetical protein FRC07_008685 [Ceratobasidium sp. 392]